MNSPASVICQVLLDLGLVNNSGKWTVYVSFLPATPDNAVCIYDTAGRLDGRIMANGKQVSHPGIQVRVRGMIYNEVWEKANAIAEGLDGLDRVPVALSSEEAYTLLNVSRSGDVVPVGIEEENGKRRHHFTVNAIVSLEKE
jgi:Bacteriophage minor capsid protein